MGKMNAGGSIDGTWMLKDVELPAGLIEARNVMIVLEVVAL